MMEKQYSISAIASTVLATVSIIMLFADTGTYSLIRDLIILSILAVLSLILGIRGVYIIGKKPEELKGNGFAAFGIVYSLFFMIVIPIFSS